MLSKRRFIDTSNRFSGTPTQGKYRMDRVEDVTSFKIDKFAYFNNQYNIDSRNNKVYFVVSVTSYTGTIVTGRYTGTTLASAIETAMNAQTAGNTVIYSSITNKMTFSRGDNLILTTTTTTSTVWDYIGFLTTADKTGSLSYESDDQVNLVSKYNYLVLSFADNPDISRDLPDDVALIIVNNQSWGTLITLNVDEEINTCKRSFEYFKYSLHDERGNIIDSSGVGFSFQLTFK